MIKSAMLVLAVPDLKRSAEYYRDVLGFEIQEMGDPGWRFYVRDSCRIMAGECREAMPVAETGDHSHFVYLERLTCRSWFTCKAGASCLMVMPAPKERHQPSSLVLACPPWRLSVID